MTQLELQTLLAPLPGEAPCGANLQFEPDFLALEEAAAGQPEREYGKTLIPAKGPDWHAVRDHAMRLAARSRDLRLAVWLTRSGARIGGLGDAIRGLQLVHGLLRQHWDGVHPQIEVGEAHGETSRLNALSSLLRAEAGLADLRAARLSQQRGALTVRDIELAAAPAEALRGEAVPTKDGVLAGVAAARVESPELLDLMRMGHEAVCGIDEILTARLGAVRSLEFAPLNRLMQQVAQAGSSASGTTEWPEPNKREVEWTHPPALSGDVVSRDEAIRQLDRICDWIERNEPASPAPIFIRRAQQLLKKSFIDIIRDLLPDNVKQIEHFAGKSNP